MFSSINFNAINYNLYDLESFDPDKTEKNDISIGMLFSENKYDEFSSESKNVHLFGNSTAFKTDFPKQNEQKNSENNQSIETIKNGLNIEEGQNYGINLGDKQDNINNINESKDKEEEIKQENVEKENKKEEPIDLDKEKEKDEEKKEEANKGELKEILIEDKNQKNNTKLPPSQYFFDDIKNNIFPKIKINNLIKEKFVLTNNLLDLENKISDKEFLAPKKRNRDKPNEGVREAKKAGRKKKDDTTNDSQHNKDSQDNIVKKIKAKIISTLLIFINSILNSFLDTNKIKSYIRIIKKIPEDKEPEYEDLLKDLDYNKTVNETKKEKNLGFLKMHLKDFLSTDISPKFSSYSVKSNKIVIDEIIKKEKDNKIIMFVLNNLTLGDYIDIFLYKKELRDFGITDVQTIDQIMTKFTRIDKLLEEIYKLNNKNNYFSIFISIIYNFERWYFIKKERSRPNKDNEKKDN